MDARAAVIHALYAMLEGAGVPLPEEQRTAHGNLAGAMLTTAVGACM